MTKSAAEFLLEERREGFEFGVDGGEECGVGVERDDGV